MDGRMASIIDGVAAGVAVSEEEIWRIRSLASRLRVAFRPPPPIHPSPPEPGGIYAAAAGKQVVEDVGYTYVLTIGAKRKLPALGCTRYECTHLYLSLFL